MILRGRVLVRLRIFLSRGLLLQIVRRRRGERSDRFCRGHLRLGDAMSIGQRMSRYGCLFICLRFSETPCPLWGFLLL